jgi:hypothetical protein
MSGHPCSCVCAECELMRERLFLGWTYVYAGEYPRRGREGDKPVERVPGGTRLPRPPQLGPALNSLSV